MKDKRTVEKLTVKKRSVNFCPTNKDILLHNILGDYFDSEQRTLIIPK